MGNKKRGGGVKKKGGGVKKKGGEKKREGKEGETGREEKGGRGERKWGGRAISSRVEEKLPCTVLQILKVSMVPSPSKLQFYAVRKYLVVPWEKTLYLFA